MTCDDVRQILTKRNGPGWPGEVSEHLSTCESCLRSAIEGALAEVPATSIPHEFENRVVTQLHTLAPVRKRQRGSLAIAAPAAAMLGTAIVGAVAWRFLGAGPASGHTVESLWYLGLALVTLAESAILIAWASEPCG